MTNHVNVKFDEGTYSTHYTYKIPDWIDPLDLVKGALVIVPVAGESLGFTVAKVASVNNNTAKKATKYIVGLVDTKRYREELVRQAKVQELENRLKARYAQLQKDSWLEELRRQDPESINMIRELESLK